ncbi:MAG: ribose 5-phosphate isomerase B [Candidatus Sumerlaeota bacterium]|nr:ribose 5-phosphate isomerase B [Candidatus Sumerlaeota bacterium]
MKIAFACDHAAIEARDKIVNTLRELGHDVQDFGVHDAASVDYSDYAVKALTFYLQGKADRVVLMCGTGLGMCYVANKAPGVRCARCMDEYDAEMSRRHNDSNCLALRSRQQDPEMNQRILKTWLETPFEGGRHQRRIDKIEAAARQLAQYAEETKE